MISARSSAGRPWKWMCTGVIAWRCGGGMAGPGAGLDSGLRGPDGGVRFCWSLGLYFGLFCLFQMSTATGSATLMTVR
jgi:hypothetical protein